jgi:hypothetical protein
MLDTYSCKHTVIICNNYCFSTATMVTQRRLIVKSHVHCLSCFYLTLNPLTWKIWWAPNNASKWQTGLNSAFKGLMHWTIRLNVISGFHRKMRPALFWDVTQRKVLIPHPRFTGPFLQGQEIHVWSIQLPRNCYMLYKVTDPWLWAMLCHLSDLN